MIFPTSLIQEKSTLLFALNTLLKKLLDSKMTVYKNYAMNLLVKFFILAMLKCLNIELKFLDSVQTYNGIFFYLS